MGIGDRPGVPPHKPPLHWDDRTGEMRMEEATAEPSVNSAGHVTSSWVPWRLAIAACFFFVLAGAWIWTNRPSSSDEATDHRRNPAAALIESPATKLDDDEADAAVLVGRVTEVTDGDTISVALSSGPIVVRLHSIDAPEPAQPYARQATAALKRHLNGAEVSLQVITQDRYDRQVAVVYLGDENVNAWMVQHGHAWAYRQYLDDPQYCAWEQQVRASGQGIWSLPSAKRLAPWEYRQFEREGKGVAPGTTVETEAGCVAAIPERASYTVAVQKDVPVAMGTLLDQSKSGKCLIKGNISDNGQIYHVPGSDSYEHTRIEPSRGERWFCTEEEARQAGWRPPRR